MIDVKWESATVRLGVAGPLVLSLYRGGVTLADLEKLDQLQAELLKTFPKIASLTFLSTRELSRLDEASQQRTDALAKKYEKQNVGVAMVVLSRGLGAVVARTFLSGFLLMSKHETPMKVFPTGAEGLEWLRALPSSPLLGLLVTDEELQKFAAW